MASTTAQSPAQQPTFDDQLPSIHALFLIRFDLRKGYTVAWKKALPGVEVDGAIEFKSLPSGLHNVHEDLVYFIHDSYAGLSAFINEPADEASRNALMLAVGVLIPRGDGRMGKSWTYAEKLHELAKEVAGDPDNTTPLENFWEQRKPTAEEQKTVNRVDQQSSEMQGQIQRPYQGYKRHRGMSDAPAKFGYKQTLSPSHPATSLPGFLRAFGPLVFPLYRAALLRKRILLVGEAPVNINCDYVYALSILASMPQNILELLPYDKFPSLRLKALFNVGIFDIPSLSPSKPSDAVTTDFPPSWVACTTDDVLATKPQLYDVIVRLPAPYTKDAPTRIYPTVMKSDPTLATKQSTHGIKATQRDARRFHNLNYHLHRQPFSSFNESLPSEQSGDSASISSAHSTFSTSSVVEPISWSIAAYSSFVWWASAGEKRRGRSEERENEIQQDEDLLFQDIPQSSANSTRSVDELSETSKELAIIAYFQRLTGNIMEVLSHAIDREDMRIGNRSRSSNLSESNISSPAGGFDGDDSEHHPLVSAHDTSASGYAQDSDDLVEITSEDMMQMGLDPWSAADRAFVEDMLDLWWGRTANLRRTRIECCGLRIL